MNIRDLLVIDASTVLAGPSVGMFFAELGAKVIKIEHPVNGDVTRTWKLPIEPQNTNVSAYFSAVNYNKEYLKLDYTSENDRQTFLDLVKNANILLTNFKKGDAEKFNLTDAVLQAINPQLIHGKISGFGQDSDRVAYDLILQAETGFMSMNGTPESGPVKMPVALIDVLAAHQLKEGILLALLEQNNKGKIVEVSLYESAICSLVNQASNYLNYQFIPQRIGSLHPNIAPYGEIFKTKDNQLITFAIGSDKHFQKLCGILNCKYLIENQKFEKNTKRVENRLELFEILQDYISQFDSAFILHSMHKEFVPVGKIKAMDEVINQETVQKLILKENIEGIDTKRLTSIAFKIKDL